MQELKQLVLGLNLKLLIYRKHLKPNLNPSSLSPIFNIESIPKKLGIPTTTSAIIITLIFFTLSTIFFELGSLIFFRINTTNFNPLKINNEIAHTPTIPATPFKD